MARGILRRLPLSLLAARDLSVTPPGAQEPAVKGVSLEIQPGRWLAIEGANGSGKTSLLLALAGLWPSGGELLLEGLPFGPGSPLELRRKVAVIQQDPASQLLQGSVYDELAFAPRNLGVPEQEVGERIHRWSGRLGLGRELGDDPGRLSAGRQQLVLLAAALVAEPRLLVADEPMAHVDSTTRRMVLDLIRKEVSQGLAVVWATQARDEFEAADARLRLGEEVRPLVRAEPVLEPARGRNRLRIRVLAAGGEQAGPRVHVDRPFEVEVLEAGLLALTGPNGVGKSVLLAAIADLTRLEQVEITWLEPATSPPILALQFPELQIFEEKVSDEITYASVSRGEARPDSLERASKLLQAMNFAPQPFLASRTWSLSMGAKRIMEVIGAIVAPSSIVLLDEPSAGLDPDRCDRLATMLGEVARTRPVVIATHDREWLDRAGIRAIEICPTGSAKSPITT